MPTARRPGRGHPGPGTAGHAAVVLLAAASGAVDALAFTALGHVFAGVMTGNLALLGIAVGGDHLADAVPPLLALAGFAAGTALSARACRTPPGAGADAGATSSGADAGADAGADTPPAARWPVRTLGCLAAEAVLLTCAAVVWAMAGPPPGGVLRDVLLVAVAVAMGAQTGAMLGAGPAARPSTYLTGTLATFITRGLGGTPGGGPGADRWVPVRLAALALGAGAMAAVLRWTPAAAPFLPPALVVAALVTVAVRVTPGAGRSRRARGAVPDGDA